MELEQLAKELEPFNYVVQRNWENLPGSIQVEGHDDLDLFVDKKSPELEEVLKKYREKFPIDVRDLEDDYYPPIIGNLILQGKVKFNGFNVPAPIPYFVSLYYHNVTHKESNPYGERLKRLFYEICPPVKPKDEGVGYYV